MASKIKHVHGVSFPRFKIRTIVQKLTSIVKHVASSFALLRCKNAIRFCDLIYLYMGPIVSAQLHSAYLVLKLYSSRGNHSLGQFPKKKMAPTLSEKLWGISLYMTDDGVTKLYVT